MSFSRRSGSILNALSSPDPNSKASSSDSILSPVASMRSPRLVRQERALQTALDAVEEMSRLHAKARAQEEAASAAHVAALETAAQVAHEANETSSSSLSLSPTSSIPVQHGYTRVSSPRRRGISPRLSSPSALLESRAEETETTYNESESTPKTSHETIRAMNDLSVARRLLEDAEMRLLASSNSPQHQDHNNQHSKSGSDRVVQRSNPTSPRPSSSSSSSSFSPTTTTTTYNNYRIANAVSPRNSTLPSSSPSSSSSSSSSSFSPSSKPILPPLLPSSSATPSNQSVFSSTPSSYLSPRQHEREAIALASASLRATRSPPVPLDFPTADEIRDALQTRMAKISSLDAASAAAAFDSEGESGGERQRGRMAGESKDYYQDREKNHEEKEEVEAWNSWSSLSAGQQADVLGIPRGTNPYMHASYSIMRIHPNVISLRKRQMLPPLFTPPLTLGVATQRSSVAVALDRLSFPAELLSSSTTTSSSSLSTSTLRNVYGDMNTRQDSQRGEGEQDNESGDSTSRFYQGEDAIAADTALQLSESSANEILASLCRLIGVNNDALNNNTNTFNGNSPLDRERQLSAVLLPRVRALAAAAVSASVLHHFAGVICSKLSSVVSLSSSSSNVSHFGLEDAVTFLDAALSELIALRASQRVNQEQTVVAEEEGVEVERNGET
jgi:hypothetical protein